MSDPASPTLLLVPTETLRLQSVPPLHGMRWIRRAFTVFGRRPMAFAGLFSAGMLGLMVLTLLPFVGLLVAFMAVPWMSLGFMVATRNAMRGKLPLISVFIEPLRTQPSRVRQLLCLGAAYTLCAGLMMLLTSVLDGDALRGLLQDSVDQKLGPQALAANPQFQSAILLRVGLSVLLTIPFWHTPALVYWGGQTWARALVFSILAMWRNKFAFVVYALGWLGLLIALSLVCTLLLGSPGMAPFMPVGVLLGMTVLTTVFYLSTYFSFAECFAVSDPTDVDTTAKTI
ncbi:MAG: BPSS1780 family membrane protein [Pseudomonadota bacterium]